jgi:hypothetical protein
MAQVKAVSLRPASWSIGGIGQVRAGVSGIARG